ncbi:MAG: bifunctional DNA-formamidopyrimidine glycosylase/DNA-(apurinic or apyrimidinic site) lyase [Eubacterium sp.]|nr:bifunctional DNA-formamidopyrimidine glycosylase/DNA-(apurinic or apyrimidinic site) lyase [Eubacterium sp.]
MPELPEVETIKRIIEPQIQGLSITEVTVRRSDLIAYPEKEHFCRLLTGQTVHRLERRGKFLLIHLESQDRVILHLRMTGCLLFTPAAFPEEKHTHIVFHMSDGNELRFSDTRRFGRFWLLCSGENDVCSGISKLGMEPFDTALTAEYLSSHMGSRKKTIKQCLLDQSMIAGIGNIYSDEILFTAGLYPARPANSLNQNDWQRLAKIIPERLSYFIQKNEISPEEYLETRGKDYRNTPFLQVYGHRGEGCPNCGTIFCHIVVGGRSSVYCPVCQDHLTH